MQTFKISHIAKMEGQVDFLALVSRGEIEKARLCVKEGARLIEGLVIGRKILEVPTIISRICGICPTVHNLCAIYAIEKALNIKVSEEVGLLRRLMLCGQIIHSHGLHLFFLSLPDFFDITSDLKLIRKYPKETKDALNIRDFGVKIVETVGGRTVHPISPKIGGFRVSPDKEKLKKLLFGYDKAHLAAVSLAGLFKNLNYPEFKRKTNFVSLVSPGKYAFSQGEVFFNGIKKKEKLKPEDFVKKAEEIEEAGEVVKRVKFEHRFHYLVGALARINNNKVSLNKEAKRQWDDFSEVENKPRTFSRGKPTSEPDFNIFHNIFAQAVEVIHFTEEARIIIEELLSRGLQEIDQEYKIKSGRGLYAVEAPRGTLFHYYEIDKSGKIVNCNIITPSAQFFANLEEDLRCYVPELFKKLCKEDCQKRIRALIRAYDPCVSCATH